MIFFSFLFPKEQNAILKLIRSFLFQEFFRRPLSREELQNKSNEHANASTKPPNPRKSPFLLTSAGAHGELRWTRTRSKTNPTALCFFSLLFLPTPLRKHHGNLFVSFSPAYLSLYALRSPRRSPGFRSASRDVTPVAVALTVTMRCLTLTSRAVGRAAKGPSSPLIFSPPATPRQPRSCLQINKVLFAV